MEKATMIGRNDPCYCGSGKKYKKCCLPRYNPYIVPPSTHYFPGIEGLDQISVSDDRDQALFCYSILVGGFSDWDEKVRQMENLHNLLKIYPQISELWAVLIIGYYGMGMFRRARKLLKRSRLRFPKNLTIRLLCFVEEMEEPPEALSFSLNTLTQILLWGSIQVRRAFEASNNELALDFMQEMVVNAKRWKQEGHWALGLSFYEMFEEAFENIDEGLIDEVIREIGKPFRSKYLVGYD